MSHKQLRLRTVVLSLLPVLLVGWPWRRAPKLSRRRRRPRS